MINTILNKYNLKDLLQEPQDKHKEMIDYSMNKIIEEQKSLSNILTTSKVLCFKAKEDNRTINVIFSLQKNRTQAEAPLLLLNDKGYPLLYQGFYKGLSKPAVKQLQEYPLNRSIFIANYLTKYSNYIESICIGLDTLGNIQASYYSKNTYGLSVIIKDVKDLNDMQKIIDDIDTYKTLQYNKKVLQKIVEDKDNEVRTALSKLEDDTYKKDANFKPFDLIMVTLSSIISTLPIDGNESFYPLHKEELKSSEIEGERDGDIIMRRISQFLREKQIPDDKRNIIIAKLNSILLSPTLNKPNNGISPLKNLFTNVVDDLGVYYKLNLGVDFTGKLFNEMYKWLGFTEDPKNDVVLTPPYVAKLLVKLAKVNKDSYVWDFCTGSAGLLIAAMEEMTRDARNTIYSPKEYEQKWLKIRAEQLIGLEILPSVYMLAVINMILMGDGSSNILEQDSLKFDGKYAYGKREGEKFPATALVLNPPYSVAGGGMVFVEKALNMMEGGYAAIIIKRQAGEGGATEFNKRILERNTLIASIKMPDDLFIGKAGVQTRVYVFKVGERHHKDQLVKFIDFSDDGYRRAAKKKSSKNLVDSGNAVERYQEVVDLVHFGKHKLNLIDESCYHEATIDPMNGADWNQVCKNDNDLEDLDSKIYETISSLIAYHM